MGDLSRQEALAAIEQAISNAEEAAHVIDWTSDMWETIDELHKRLGPDLARQVINARRPPTFEEALSE